MKILLVNDDGITAPGLAALVKALQPEHEVVVAAPDAQRSGFSHAVTLHGTLRCAPEKVYDCPAYRVDGTPCDCVKIGLLSLFDGVDLVISGINETVNVGTDILYSGTVNAAIEAAMTGVKGIAVSVNVVDDDYSYVAEFVANNVEKLAAMCDARRIVSVNFPTSRRQDIKGIRVASCGDRLYDDYYIVFDDGYRLRGTPKALCNEENSDVLLCENGYIAVSPVTVQFTDPQAMLLWQEAVESLCW